MTEKECVSIVAAKAGITKVAAAKAIESFVILLSGAMGTGDKVNFPGGSIGDSKITRTRLTPDLCIKPCRDQTMTV